MKTKKRTRRNRARSGIDFPVPPPANLITYKGPIPTRTSERGIVVSVRALSTLSTGVGTSFNVLLDNNPSGADNWSEYSTAWAEYKVLGMRFEVIPTAKVNTAALASGPLITNVLHQSTAPGITTLTNCFSFGDPSVHNTTDHFVFEWRLQDTDESLWQLTSAPGRTSYTANFFSSGLTTATTYGYVYITYLVQFHNATA
jgi:hypothetical protein